MTMQKGNSLRNSLYNKSGKLSKKVIYLEAFLFNSFLFSAQFKWFYSYY